MRGSQGNVCYLPARGGGFRGCLRKDLSPVPPVRFGPIREIGRGEPGDERKLLELTAGSLVCPALTSAAAFAVSVMLLSSVSCP
jgi:hypothetical protein